MAVTLLQSPRAFVMERPVVFCCKRRTTVRLLFGLTVFTASLGVVQLHLQVMSQQQNENSFQLDGFLTGVGGGGSSNHNNISGGIRRTLFNNHNNNAQQPQSSEHNINAAHAMPFPTATATSTSVSLNFIPNHQLGERDYFSDSWLLNKQRFLELPVDTIGIIEDAVFVAVGHKKKPFSHSKMTVDWLEFCVEHLSKWWNDLDVWRHEGGNVHNSMMPMVLGKLDDYLTYRVKDPSPAVKQATNPSTMMPRNTTLQHTIAIIAFVPYKPKGRKRSQQDLDRSKRKQLNARSLAATIASLYQAGFGRVVVVGINDEDAEHVRAASDILTSRFPPATVNSASNLGNVATIGVTNMEIGHVHVTDPTWWKTNFAKFNVPKAAIVGLQKALRGEFRNNITQQRQWIGQQHANDDPNYWKYVYLTEPDTLLYTQTHLLSHLRQALDDGISLFPHRLHIIPHEVDLPPRLNNASIGDAEYVLNAGEFLPNVGTFANISILDPLQREGGRQTVLNATSPTTTIYTSCCDGGPKWPGISGWKKCVPWWTCGRKKIDYEKGEVYNRMAIAENNPRLQPYPMMRLQSGFGAIFASSNHGRRCWPSLSQCPDAEDAGWQ